MDFLSTHSLASSRKRESPYHFVRVADQSGSLFSLCYEDTFFHGAINIYSGPNSSNSVVMAITKTHLNDFDPLKSRAGVYREGDIHYFISV